MTAGRTGPAPHARGAGWTGRASQHRRRQVRARGSEVDAQVHDLWSSLVDVLESIDGACAAVMCTVDGTPVATYGLPRTSEPRAALATRDAYVRSGGHDLGSAPFQAVETVELTRGTSSTVVAGVPGATHGDHLLSVTAEGVSPYLLEAWTRRAAEDLRSIWSAAAE
jgi:hypothetical protein